MSKDKVSNDKVTVIGSDKGKVTIIVKPITEVFKFIGKKLWSNEATQ